MFLMLDKKVRKGLEVELYQRSEHSSSQENLVTKEANYFHS